MQKNHKKTFMNNIRIIFFTSLVLIGTGVHFFIRSNLRPIYNETRLILFVEDEVEEQGLTSAKDYWSKNWINIWKSSTDKPLHKKFIHKNRPLQETLVSFYILHFHIFNNNPLVPIFINSFILGLSGGFLYLLALKLTGDQFSSVGAAFLMIFSGPAISGTWIVVAGSHPLVPLFICTAMLSYMNYKEKGSIRWLAMLFLLLFVAPFYKEYLCLLPFIIIFSEIVSPSRNWLFLFSMLPLLFHGFNPSFIIDSLFFKTSARASPFAPYINYILTQDVKLRLHAFNHLMFAIPPSFSLIWINAVLFKIFRAKKFNRLMSLLICAFLSLLYLSLFAPPGTALQPVAGYLSFLFVIGISLSALWINRILAVWFIISWLPYLLQYFSKVHLLYSIGPLAIILLRDIKTFIQHSVNNKNSRSATIKSCFLVLLISAAFIDQALNPIGAYQTYKATSDTAINIAKKMSENSVPGKQNVLISHTVLGKDVKYYFKKKEGKNIKINGFTKFMLQNKRTQDYRHPLRFKSLLENDKDTHNIFLLDVSKYPTLLSELIQDPQFNISKIYVNKVDITYPYTDPIKFFIPFEYTSFPGSPDMGDFVLLTTHLFHRKIQGNQLLYLVN